MKVLIAEDDAVSRRALEASLSRWGYDAVVVENGTEAWEILEKQDAPRLAILDWVMPRMDGLELCRKVRTERRTLPTYIILLTMKGAREDVVRGFEAGADDYLKKPYDQGELRARVEVGARVVELQTSLAERVQELEESLHRVKQLQGLLPICSYCKKIRNDSNYWQQVEAYISEHSEAQFSHGVCPDCYEAIVKPELQKLSPPGREGP